MCEIAGIVSWSGCRLDNRLVFTPEIKALLQDPTFVQAVNPETVHDFLLLGLQDHSEHTFFSDIFQLRPGHALILDQTRWHVYRWRDFPAPQPDDGMKDNLAAEPLQTLFQDAIRLHLRSDAAVGSCLSDVQNWRYCSHLQPLHSMNIGTRFE